MLLRAGPEILVVAQAAMILREPLGEFGRDPLGLGVAGPGAPLEYVRVEVLVGADLVTGGLAGAKADRATGGSRPIPSC